MARHLLLHYRLLTLLITNVVSVNAMKVLIVDDNEELAVAIRNVVERERECSAQTAHDVANGYAAYLRFRPDIIITDVEMPGQSGFDLMREIRHHDPGIRTIYMSGDPF